MLQKENFLISDNNVISFKIFADICLSGGMGFDIGKLWSQDYAWLAFLLLNSNNNKNLAYLPELKRQLLVFTDTEVAPSLLSQMNETLLQELIKLYKGAVYDDTSQINSL